MCFSISRFCSGICPFSSHSPPAFSPSYSHPFCPSFKALLFSIKAILKQLRAEDTVRMVVLTWNSNFQQFIQQVLKILPLNLYRKFLLFLHFGGIWGCSGDSYQIAVFKEGENHIFAFQITQKRLLILPVHNTDKPNRYCLAPPIIG